MAVTQLQITPGYYALRERAAWLDLSARGKIRATGEDRARLLHALTTNHVEILKPGEGCYVFFLNAQGRILGDASILCFEDHLLIDTEPETRRKLFEHLDRYIIADDVTIEDRTDSIATIAVEGPAAAEVLAKAGAPIPESAVSWLNWGDRTVARISSTGSPGFFIFTPKALKDALIHLLGLPEASAEDARTVRLEHGHPRYGEDITERNLVQETGQLHAVHLNKGCYLGQEIVERVRSVAKIHKVLRLVELNTENPPAIGTKTDQLEIMSSAFSPTKRKTYALAYVKIQSAEPGMELTVGEARGVVLSIR